METIKKYFNFLLDYTWPQFCLGCQKEGFICCDDCQQKIRLLPLDWQTWSHPQQFNFNRCYICVDYADPLIKKLIKNFKYGYLQSIAKILSNLMTQQAEKLQLNPDTIITNTPLHRRKLKKRGFDQTLLLAKNLAHNLNLTYLPLLKRSKNTAAQAKLNKTEREKNVKNAFLANLKWQNEIKHKTIILVDDIVTTGSTLNEAAKALKVFTPNQIITLAVAKNSELNKNV